MPKVRVTSRKGLPDKALVAPSRRLARPPAVQCSNMTRRGVKPGAPGPHPKISPGSESREKLRSQMGFSLFYFCTLQPLSLSLTIKHNLWATLWWPKERKQQEQKLKGEKGRD